MAQNSLLCIIFAAHLRFSRSRVLSISLQAAIGRKFKICNFHEKMNELLFREQKVKVLTVAIKLNADIPLILENDACQLEGDWYWIMIKSRECKGYSSITVSSTRQLIPGPIRGSSSKSPSLFKIETMDQIYVRTHL